MAVPNGLNAINLILQGSGTAATGVGSLGTLLADGTGTTVGVLKQGTGQWNLMNFTNSYSGPTTISAGILSAAKLDNGGNPSGIGTGSLVLQGGTLQYTGTGDPTTRGFTMGNATTAAGGGIDSEGTGPVVFNGNMSGINTAASTQTLTLTAGATTSGANALNGNIVDSNTGTGALTGVAKAGAGAWTLGGTTPTPA